MASSCWGMPELMCEFPSLSNTTLRHMRMGIDDGFRGIVRTYTNQIDAATRPLQWFLNTLENAFTNTPWLIVMVLILLVVWLGSRNLKIVLGSAIGLALIGIFGLWEDTMTTLAMVTVATLIAIILGLPIGILMARSDRMQQILTPVLDVMQTMPSFVYLIPVVVIFGIGKVPGVIAVVIYAIPPMIRLTNLGIRLVDKEVIEAADAFGANPRQKLWGVQLPLSLPTIMAGVNQTIMMSLAMVVIASLVSAPGLGVLVLRGIRNLELGVGLVAGLGIVLLAVILDRVTKAALARVNAAGAAQKNS